MKNLLDAIDYERYSYKICGDLEVIQMLMGMQNMAVYCVSGIAGQLINM